MKIFYIILFTLILYSTSLYSQEDTTLFFEKDFNVDDYKIILRADNSDFFSGSISVIDKNNDTVFFREDIFTRYISDTLIDLDNNGSNEFILDLGTGVNAYDFNMLVIFDFSKSDQPYFEIHNAEIVAGTDSIPKIVSHIRFSPLYLGTGYDYSLRYNGDRLVLETDPDSSKVLQSLDIIEEDFIENLNGFKDEMDECDILTNYISFYEQYIFQKMLLGKEQKGWDFFNKYYTCPNKNSARDELKESMKSLYKYLSEMDHSFQFDG
ncbi:MAG: hypothetical protein WAT71_08950 [Ignavibacteria bacterium]